MYSVIFPVTLPWLNAVVRAFSFVRMLPSIRCFWFGLSTLPDELRHSRVFVNVILRLPGTFHSPRDQNNLDAWILIGQTSVE